MWICIWDIHSKFLVLVGYLWGIKIFHLDYNSHLEYPSKLWTFIWLIHLHNGHSSDLFIWDVDIHVGHGSSEMSRYRCGMWMFIIWDVTSPLNVCLFEVQIYDMDVRRKRECPPEAPKLNPNPIYFHGEVIETRSGVSTDGPTTPNLIIKLHEGRTRFRG